ncbi:hypothetical protein HID58_047109, partial [Brassica napus]
SLSQLVSISTHSSSLSSSSPSPSHRPHQLGHKRADAVSVTVAESDADFSFLSGYGQRPVSELHNLLPELPVSDASLTAYALQITLFPNSGFSIGVTAHHAVLDGKTTSMFFKAWAHVCKQENRVVSLPETLTPSLDRSLIKDQTGLDEQMIEMSLHLSTFVLAYAYAWTCLVKARGGNGERLVSFLFVGDFRARLDPPLPASFRRRWSSRERMDSSRRSDLGWGRPVKTDVVSIQGEGISMPERRDESGGVEIGMCMKKTDMDIATALFNSVRKHLAYDFHKTSDWSRLIREVNLDSLLKRTRLRSLVPSPRASSVIYTPATRLVLFNPLEKHLIFDIVSALLEFRECHYEVRLFPCLHLSFLTTGSFAKLHSLNMREELKMMQESWCRSLNQNVMDAVRLH